MSVFIGDYICKADSKCRVVVPASFRKVMETSGQTLFVLRKNVFEDCIDMYPYPVWEERISKLRSDLNLLNRKHAAFLREFCRGTQEVEMDGNGRVLLPRRMLEEVGIEKELVFAAQDAVIQIWDAKMYEEVAVGGEELGRMAEEIFGSNNMNNK